MTGWEQTALPEYTLIFILTAVFVVVFETRNPCLMFSDLYKKAESTCDSLLAQTNLSECE